jgi:hypothetical protein
MFGSTWIALEPPLRHYRELDPQMSTRDPVCNGVMRHVLPYSSAFRCKNVTIRGFELRSQGHGGLALRWGLAPAPSAPTGVSNLG